MSNIHESIAVMLSDMLRYNYMRIDELGSVPISYAAMLLRQDVLTVDNERELYRMFLDAGYHPTPQFPLTFTDMALDDVDKERERQEQIAVDRRAEGVDWHSCADVDMPGGDTMRLTVLAEEFGEIANALLENDTENLYTEIIQTAAVAVAWAESILASRS